MTSSRSGAVGVVLVVTVIEDAGLIVWLGMLRASMALVGLAIAGLVLLIFLITEHSIMQRAENPDFTGRVLLRLFGFTVLEVINWRVWLALLPSDLASFLSMGSLVASAFFFVGFYIEHQITENVISNQPYLNFRNANRVITVGVILETLSEGVGARLWVQYGAIGIAFLVVGSIIEHSIQYVVGKQPVTRQVTRGPPSPSSIRSAALREQITKTTPPGEGLVRKCKTRDLKKLGKFPKTTKLKAAQLFSGTLHFVQVTFTGGLKVPDADLATAIQHAILSSPVISRYCSQYGPNQVNVNNTVIPFTFNGTSYSDADLQGWVATIAKANNIPTTDALVFLSPQGALNTDAPVTQGVLGYHGINGTHPYSFVNVLGTGLTVDDGADLYAVALSHEIAEMCVDPAADLSNPEVCDPCVLPGELLLGDNKSIKDCQEGDDVIGELGPEPILETFVREYTGELVEIKALGMLPVTVTPNHPVKIVEANNTGYSPPKWKPAGELVTKKRFHDGDYLVMPRLTGSTSKTQINMEPYIQQYRLNSANSGQGTGPRFGIYPYAFPLNEDTAWLLGVYVAEGWATPETGKIGFAIHLDEIVFREKIVKVIAGLGCKAWEDPPVGKALKIHMASVIYSLFFPDACGDGAPNKKIPECILYHRDRSLLKAFLDGYLEGDGSMKATTKGYEVTRFTTVSKTLAQQLQLAFGRLGIFVSLSRIRRERNETIQGREVDCRDTYEGAWCSDNRATRFKRLHNDAFYLPIKTIARQPYAGPVHNIETPDNTYLVSNAIVHNCAGNCLPPNEMLLGDNKAIMNYQTEDFVLGEKGLQQVTETFERDYTGELIEIKALGMLPFKVTSDHPIQIVHGEDDTKSVTFNPKLWKPAAKIIPKKPHENGDYLTLPQIQGTISDTSISLTRYIETWTHTVKAPNKNRHALPTSFPLTEDTAWMLGLFVAEGCTNIGKRSSSVHFTIGSRETATKDRLAKVCSSLGRNTSARRQLNENCIHIRFRSVIHARFFREVMGDSCYEKKIPDFILYHTDTSLLEAFLAGYMEGDGSEGNTRGHHFARFSTTSKTLALQLQLAYGRLGIFVALHRTRKEGSGKILGRNVHLHEQFVGAYGEYGDARLNNGLFYLPVKTVQPSSYAGKVYNLETEDHTFLVGNAVVHNCGVDHRNYFDANGNWLGQNPPSYAFFTDGIVTPAQVNACPARDTACIYKPPP